MSTIEEELRTQLLSDTAIAGLLADRIMPDVAPGEIVLPCAVYSHLATAETSNMDREAYLAAQRIGYSCLGATWLAAMQLLQAIRKKALATRGLFNGIMIDSIYVADVRDQGFNKITNSYQIDLDLEINQTQL